MQNFFNSFELPYSSEFDIYYKNGNAEFNKHKNEILNFEHHGIFTYMNEKIREIRDALKMDEKNVLYCYFLASVLDSGDDMLIHRICRPKASEKSELFDTLPLFSLLSKVPEMKANLKKLGIPDTVIADTLNMFENQIQDFIDLNGHTGISSYVNWMMKFINCEIIRVGRFNLELYTYDLPYHILKSGSEIRIMPDGITFHKSGEILGSAGCTDSEGSFAADFFENDEFYEGRLIENGVCKNETVRLLKTEWSPLLNTGDKIINVHIPSGSSLNFEDNSKDFLYGAELFGKAFSPCNVFYCESWLLNPHLKEIIGKETNITRFGDRFIKFPFESSGNDVFEYLYFLPADTNPYELPEKSSLQRAVKNHLLGGNHVLSYHGIFTADMLSDNG